MYVDMHEVGRVLATRCLEILESLKSVESGGGGGGSGGGVDDIDEDTLKYALKLEFKGDTVLAVNTFARSLWYAVPHTLRPRLLALALACSALTSSVLAFPRVWLVTGAPTPMTIAKRSLRLLTSRRMLP